MTQFHKEYAIKTNDGKWMRDIAKDGHPIMGRKAIRFSDFEMLEEYAIEKFGCGNFKIVAFNVA